MSQEWRLQAACRGSVDERAFGTAPQQEEFIAEFCRRCWVQIECGQFAVDVDADGVYGGTTRRRRADLGLVPRAADRRATDRRWGVSA